MASFSSVATPTMDAPLGGFPTAAPPAPVPPLPALPPPILAPEPTAAAGQMDARMARLSGGYGYSSHWQRASSACYSPSVEGQLEVTHNGTGPDEVGAPSRLVAPFRRSSMAVSEARLDEGSPLFAPHEKIQALCDKALCLVLNMSAQAAPPSGEPRPGGSAARGQNSAPSSGEAPLPPPSAVVLPPPAGNVEPRAAHGPFRWDEAACSTLSLEGGNTLEGAKGMPGQGSSPGQATAAAVAGGCEGRGDGGSHGDLGRDMRMMEAQLSDMRAELKQTNLQIRAIVNHLSTRSPEASATPLESPALTCPWQDAGLLPTPVLRFPCDALAPVPQARPHAASGVSSLSSPPETARPHPQQPRPQPQQPQQLCAQAGFEAFSLPTERAGWHASTDASATDAVRPDGAKCPNARRPSVCGGA